MASFAAVAHCCTCQPVTCPACPGAAGAPVRAASGSADRAPVGQKPQYGTAAIAAAGVRRVASAPHLAPKARLQAFTFISAYQTHSTCITHKAHSSDCVATSRSNSQRLFGRQPPCARCRAAAAFCFFENRTGSVPTDLLPLYNSLVSQTVITQRLCAALPTKPATGGQAARRSVMPQRRLPQAPRPPQAQKGHTQLARSMSADGSMGIWRLWHSAPSTCGRVGAQGRGAGRLTG